MLAVCKSNRLFDIVPDKEYQYECPFLITTQYSLKQYYVTPSGCLLYYQGLFYNPCRHPERPCSNANTKIMYTVQEIAAQSAHTLVRFDVRSTGSDEILGSWPIKFFDIDESKNEAATQVVERILRWRATSSSSTAAEDSAFEASNLPENALNRGANIPWRLSKEFIAEIFSSSSNDRAKGSIGNTKPMGKKGWATAEGLVTDERSDAADFCDGIADWWPDVSFISPSDTSTTYGRIHSVVCFIILNTRNVCHPR